MNKTKISVIFRYKVYHHQTKFVHLLSKFKDTMNLLGLSFVLYVLKLSSGSGFCISFNFTFYVFSTEDRAGKLAFSLHDNFSFIYHFSFSNRNCVPKFSLTCVKLLMTTKEFMIPRFTRFLS